MFGLFIQINIHHFSSHFTNVAKVSLKINPTQGLFILRNKINKTAMEVMHFKYYCCTFRVIVKLANTFYINMSKIYSSQEEFINIELSYMTFLCIYDYREGIYYSCILCGVVVNIHKSTANLVKYSYIRTAYTPPPPQRFPIL